MCFDRFCFGMVLILAGIGGIGISLRPLRRAGGVRVRQAADLAVPVPAAIEVDLAALETAAHGAVVLGEAVAAAPLAEPAAAEALAAAVAGLAVPEAGLAAPVVDLAAEAAVVASAADAEQRKRGRIP